MTSYSRPQRRTINQIFAAPFAIGILSAIGLIAALVGDGVWDGVSWLALAVPIVLFLFFLTDGHRRGGR